ncbi:hypothetical protein G6F31_021099 [Rhizopus arrhizus]|nr:hypothetical protein G6F31_021099 [Rhizopus arrhizus]
MLAAEVIHVPGAGGRARGIQAMQLRTVPNDSEAVRAQAVADGFGQRQRGRRGDGRIHGIAAAGQDPQACLGGQWLRGGDHVAGEHRNPGGGVGVFPVEIHAESSRGVSP